MTNFRHLGAALLNRLPKPTPQKSADGPVKGPWSQARIAWGFFAVCTILMLFPWTNFAWTTDHSRGIELATTDFLDLGFDAPNALMFIELLSVCLLCTFERRLHPLRARLISIVLLGFCITQSVYFTFVNTANPLFLTVFPFVFFLVVCLLTVELIVRSLYELQKQFQHQFVRAYHRYQVKEENRRRAKAERLQEWMGYWTNWMRK